MEVTYKKKDFASDQEVKWCPGCGDYAILASVQQAMAKRGVAPHDIAIISGIGCSSRFPYYMNTYGLHSIHGRAPAFATGVKLHNPHLDVWVITGDGDGLSIGAGHLAHLIRRNVDLNIILFNNEIYGLTKGQYSPTSQKGLKTKSSPMGSIDKPFHPGEFILGAGSSFYARTLDTDPKHMTEVFLEAGAHKGTSFIEVYQNCVIFNDKVHDQYTGRATRDDHSVRLVHGEKILFGKEGDKGLALDGFELKVVSAASDDILVFNKHDKNIARLLLQKHANIPAALGVVYSEQESASFDEDFHYQLKKESKQQQSMQELLESAETWTV